MDVKNFVSNRARCFDEFMTNRIQLVRLTMFLLSGGLSLALLTGCESLQDTTFAPAEVRLELVPAGGAQHFVVVNASGQTLHHYWFRAYVWDDQAIFYTGGLQANTPRRVRALTYTGTGSGPQWEPGKVLRFKDWNLPSEGSIVKPVSRVQIVGSCDEGPFRENWQINASGQLEWMRNEKN